MKILVLGASGLLGNAAVRVLAERTDWQVYGTLRSEAAKKHFAAPITDRLIGGIDVEQHDVLTDLFTRVRPNVVVNCIGLIKQLADADDPLRAVPVNTLLPHRLSGLCELAGARLIHISTDCVFSGQKGNYSESDAPDAYDLYGRTKSLGEVDKKHAVTLRTSIIGHELNSAHGLLNWFLTQERQCKGYTKAIFSGVPTVVLAGIIRDVVIARPDLRGVYHVAAEPIAKYDLLRAIATVYGKEIEIVPDDKVRIDRSLNADRFREATGYSTPPWDEMIRAMHAFR